jgi:hypothetical protein
VVAITKGQLDLGPWEQIFYGEFDGRRRKPPTSIAAIARVVSLVTSAGVLGALAFTAGARVEVEAVVLRFCGGIGS